jgi:predicted AlkP superfamily pyrophosphatase or phosphodiesterase
MLSLKIDKDLMMKCCQLSFLFLFTAGLRVHAQRPERPRLIVGIVVDQMRWDYLYRFYDRYGEGGLKRLMKEGFNCQNTKINYLPSYTAPGHAAIYTGSVPALHGIVANEWIDRNTGKAWYCTEDSSVKSVGGGKAGLMSPRNLLASTVTDELRLATNFRARVFGISIKDRGAILPAGHSANAAYWYDGENGRFISSSYYRSALPDWLRQFNRRDLADSLMQLNWETLYPADTYVQSTADNNAYEGVVKGEDQPVFPHETARAAARKDYRAIRTSPYGNTIVRMMAEACIAGEKLGRNNECDFLAVSFSSTDYIGHQYGPNSMEAEDTYLRLDRELALFLKYLDEQIGAGNYLVFLTADHGAAHNARFLEDHGIPAKSVSISTIKNRLNTFLGQKYTDSVLVESLMNYQVHLNESAIAARKINRLALREDIIRWLREQPGVTTVLDMENPERNAAVAPIRSMAQNGYFPERCGSIQLILNPGWYSGYAATGTTHGSWNPYDSHIPLLWYGWHIHHGETYRQTEITDIAATLAALLHIQEPNACIGKAITEVLAP